MRKILFILCGMLLFLSCHDKSVYKEPDTDVELLKPYKDLGGHRAGGVCFNREIIW